MRPIVGRAAPQDPRPAPTSADTTELTGDVADGGPVKKSQLFVEGKSGGNWSHGSLGKGRALGIIDPHIDDYGHSATEIFARFPNDVSDPKSS